MSDATDNVVRLVPRTACAKGPRLTVDGFYLQPETGDLALYLRDADGNTIVMKYDLRDWSGPKSFNLSLFAEFWESWGGSTGRAS